MAFYGRPRLPFARPKTLQTLETPKTTKRPLQWLLMGFQRRQKPTSMAFYGRPSLPFARAKTLQTPKTLNFKTPKRPLRRSSVPLARHSQPTGIRHQAFKPAVYYFFPSQRRPWQKTCSHTPFDGQFALSSRHWPHSLCKRGKRTHTLFPSQRHPSQKTCSHTPFDGRFALSSRHWPHSLCKRGKRKHTLFPAQRHPAQKTASHTLFDGLFSLSSRHWPHSLCKRGKRKHTLFPAQRHPSQKTASHTLFDGLFSLSSRHWPHSLCTRGKRTHTLSQRPARPTPGNGYRMRAGDLPGPSVYCSSQTFCKRDKHIGNSCLSSLFWLHLPATSPSPSRCPCSAACSSFLPACLCFFPFRRLLYVALLAAGLPAFGRCPLFSVFVPRWPRHQSSPAPPSAFRRCLPVGHVHLQARLCSLLFGSLVWDAL